VARGAVKAGVSGGPTTPPLPDNHIAYTIDVVYRGLNVEIARRLSAAGFADIRPAHGKVFEQMGPTRTVSEMAARAQVTKQSMGELIAELEDLGYVERQASPSDRRAKVVRPTANGRRCIEAGWRIIGELTEEWERRMGPDRIAALTVDLADLAELFEPQDRRGQPERPPARRNAS
jgi:DNA-binding MarR family transcriptional regulator